jgi:hypothetical protein
MLHKDYDSKGSVEKIFDLESQGAWRQDELIGSKPPVTLNMICERVLRRQLEGRRLL